LGEQVFDKIHLLWLLNFTLMHNEDTKGLFQSLISVNKKTASYQKEYPSITESHLLKLPYIGREKNAMFLMSHHGHKKFTEWETRYVFQLLQ